MKIQEVLVVLKNADWDTNWSRQIYDVEEGLEDKCIRKDREKSAECQISIKDRRDWIILWEIYGKKMYGTTNVAPNQRFHLENYLQFKLQNGLKLEDDFEKKCYRYINNAALILYIREIVFKETEDSLKPIAEKVVDYYKRNKKVPKNRAGQLSKS
ncbi:hypothetical protein [Weissella cibaria]|uniref:hypothetical protein n=1 Tax=Weissella cibaria TaxID=137591 RepID=UPI001C1F548E|nr:hypothetical protein [Weissella cibaria]MBU7545443.1 hypothetical protein [Weissella cibaria]MCV3318684.1 hypothetical protein [Weissella cibaria]